MSDSGENKYKWTPESTTLLVSVWTDKQVQKQLLCATKAQLIWESVAKYMNKKGYNVNGKQCRSRMKQVLVCYREAKRAGTRAGVEQYYDSIDRVLKIKKFEQGNNNGIDTVDSIIKSPPKDVKTNKNIQVRSKFQQPPESIYRTEALSPVWSGRRDSDYPDSPESNETVLAQPYRVLSPVRDAATNTTQQQLGTMNKKTLQQNVMCEEAPIKETYRQNCTNYFSEIPFQNTVQNVQNQIIQENMQQHQAILQQNLLQNQLLEQNRLQMNPVLRQNMQNVNQALYNDQGMCTQGQLGFGQNTISENILRMQGKSQLNSVNNQAVPQEPRKPSFRMNLAATHRQFQEAGIPNYNGNLNHFGILSPSISPDIPLNLNEAFYQKNEAQCLNTNADLTTITNNATFNDDSISIEFLQESQTPDSEPIKLKDFAVNTDEMPNIPFRKKKAEKLERLMMSAINSQNEVVNKILAAQNEMVTRVLDLDRDRQNRLENRLDHLLDVVQTAVLNKSSEKSSEISPTPPEPFIANLMPPPKPGVVPPKLDLVPPKPCRVPCTVSNCNSQPVNQSPPVTTRPGVVSPISPMSPSKKIGTIWQKLGPVSTSPFVKAQQQLGFKPVYSVGNDVRTQSSAERRITKEFEVGMDTRALQFETEKFLDAERQIQEEVENARIKSSLNTQREPTPGMILSAAFLDAEIQHTEIIENIRLNQFRKKQWEAERDFCNRPSAQYKYNDYNTNNNVKRNGNILLTGQGDNYELLRQINERERAIGNPCDSSTPSKLQQGLESVEKDEPRQTIQQLAQRVMNSARWRNPTVNPYQRKDLNLRPENGNNQKSSCPVNDDVILRNVAQDTVDGNRNQFENRQLPQQVDSRTKTLDWLQDRFSFNGQHTTSKVQDVGPRFSYNEIPPPKPSRSIGFTTEFINREDNNNRRLNMVEEKRVGFVQDKNMIDSNKYRFNDDPFEDLQQYYIHQQFKLHQSKGLPFMMQNGKVILPQNDVIERYMQDTLPKNKQSRDDDSDNEEEFLDTTTSMPSSRKNSLTSTGTKSGKESGCIIS